MGGSVRAAAVVPRKPVAKPAVTGAACERSHQSNRRKRFS